MFTVKSNDMINSKLKLTFSLIKVPYVEDELYKHTANSRKKHGISGINAH